MRRFRLLRRLTAVVAQLVFLQLALASGAAACPLGDGAMSGMGAPASDAGSPHGQHSRPDAEASAAAVAHAAPPTSPHQSGEHCHQACMMAGCAAGGHCAGTATVHRAHDRWPDGAHVAHASTVSDAAPGTVRTAPEPPPPRALV